jgi:hypothetical protein
VPATIPSTSVRSSRRCAAIAKRELIEPKSGDKRYARRDERGHFTNEQDDVGKTLTQDRRKHVKHEAPHGEGDCDAGSQ